jgi:hypothetical protein
MVSVPRIGDFHVVDLACGLVSAILAVTWAIMRNADGAWFLQDILGVAFLLFAIRTISLPNVAVASAFLWVAFTYDIFWVFISPYIFKQSVMVAVATGESSSSGSNVEGTPTHPSNEGIPMVLRAPRASDPFGGYGVLGLGDVFIPGMLAALCRRFDISLAIMRARRAIRAAEWEEDREEEHVGHVGSLSDGDDNGGDPAVRRQQQQHQQQQQQLQQQPTRDRGDLESGGGGDVVAGRRLAVAAPAFGYFPLVVLGYITGLILTVLALVIMKKGQPALLYMVPCMLLPLYLVSHRRGEFSLLWKGLPGSVMREMTRATRSAAPQPSSLSSSSSSARPAQLARSGEGSEEESPLVADSDDGM